MIEVVILKSEGNAALATEIQKLRNEGWSQIGNMVANGRVLFQQMEKVTIDPMTQEEREHSRL